MEFAPLSNKSSLFRWASLRSQLLWVWDGQVAPESRTHYSDHSTGYWVWLLKAGTVRVQLGETSWEARAGQWIVSPQGRTTQEFSEDARILSVHFLCQWATGENLFLGTDAIVWEAENFPGLERTACELNRLVHRHLPKIRMELMEQAIDYPFFLRIEERFLHWLGEFHKAMIKSGRGFSQRGSCDDRLSRAERCLRESPMTEPFPDKQLQAETALGRAHLDRLFWKEFGGTTREYWEKLRENAATRMLEASSYTMKEITYELGFKQPSHFTKWFRRRFKSTPKAFREQSPVERAV